jgi:hypothetical protein
MRVPAFLTLCLALGVTGGCGAAVSSCSRAAVKVGTSSGSKVGVGVGTKGTAILATEPMESLARSSGRVAPAAEAEGVEVGGKSSFRVPHSVASESNEPASGASFPGITSRLAKGAKELGKEASEEGIQNLPDLIGNDGSRDRRRNDEQSTRGEARRLTPLVEDRVSDGWRPTVRFEHQTDR